MMKIAIIGVGEMGGAIARGLLAVEGFNPGDLTIAAPHQSTLNRFADTGVSMTTDNSVAVMGADLVILAVKPNIAPQVVGEIKPTLDYRKQQVASVVAGLTAAQLGAMLDKGDGVLPPVYLMIPNIAIAVKASMTFIAPANATDEQTADIVALFDLLGGTLLVDEPQLNAGMTLASCGIAYAMRYVRAASEGGVQLGFRAADAKNIVLQTMLGAVRLLQATGGHPEEEIDKVTTAGGITIRGLNEMEHAGFSSAVIRGLMASKI